MKTIRTSVSCALHMMLRHAWLRLCASDMVDPRRAPHPWREIGITATGERIEIKASQVPELLMICGIAFDAADGRDAKSIGTFAGKIAAKAPGVAAMTIDAWKAAHRQHALPPLHQVPMSEGWQDLHDVWGYVR